MPKHANTVQQIISKLREAQVLIGQGQTIPAAAKAIGITDQTYYRWRKEYGGLRTDQAQGLKELEVENNRLNKLVMDLSLDNAIGQVFAAAFQLRQWRIGPQKAPWAQKAAVHQSAMHLETKVHCTWRLDGGLARLSG